MDDALIAVKGLNLSFDGRRVLHDVNFEIGPAEIVTIVGPNGSGKSSFLRALIGAQKPDGGRIDRKENLKIGYVPQKLQLDQAFPITVERFVGMGAKVTKSDCDSILNKTGLGQSGNIQLTDLSGGQLQRALLAHALVGSPDILVLDEATRGLDQPAVAGFYRLIEEFRSELGCAVLMVSHDLHVVMSASDRVVCLNGHVCCEGTPTVVSEAPEYRRLFGLGTEGALALYRHDHDHHHSHEDHDHA